MQLHWTLPAQLSEPRANRSRSRLADGIADSSREKQAAASTVLRISKEGKNGHVPNSSSWSTVRRTGIDKTQFAPDEFQFKRGSFSPEKEPAGDSASNNLQSHTVVPKLDNLGIF